MKQNRIIAVIGKKGKGKSYHIERDVTGKQNVLWIDTGNLYVPAMLPYSDFSKTLPGFRRMDVETAYRRLLPDVFGENKKHFNIVAHIGRADTRNEALELLWKAIERRYAHYGQRVTLVLDEVQLYAKNSFYPTVVRNIPAMGRHYMVDQYYAVRRPHELPTDVRSNADDWYVFQTNETKDLSYLKEWIPRADLAKVPRLGVGQYLHYTVNKDSVSWLLNKPPSP